MRGHLWISICLGGYVMDGCGTQHSALMIEYIVNLTSIQRQCRNKIQTYLKMVCDRDVEVGWMV